MPKHLTFNKGLKINPGLQDDTPPFPEGTEGVPYSAQLQVSGGTAPYHFTASALPAGLSCSDSGLISGTPAGGTSAGGGQWNPQFTVADSSP